MMNLKSLFPKAMFWAIAFLAPSPLLWMYFSQLWKLDQYQYFPVLILSVVILFSAEWDRVLRFPTWKTSTLLFTAYVFTAAGGLQWSPLLGGIALVLICGSFLWSQQSAYRASFGMLYLWPVTWMLLRLPLNLDLQLMTGLQMLTAKISSHLLDMAGIPNRLMGSVFDLSHGKLFVAEACSGVQSVFSLIFVATLWVTWQKRSIVLLPVYILFAIFWAGVMNITRVFMIAWGQERWQVDLSVGWKHELLGYACLVTAILLLLSTDRFVRVVFFPMRSGKAGGKFFNPLLWLWNRGFKTLAGLTQVKLAKPMASSSSPPYLLIGVTVVLAAVSIGFEVTAATGREAIVAREFKPWVPQQGLLEGTLPGLVITEQQTIENNSRPELGEHANTWTGTIDGMPVKIHISQHREFHDLCVCYSTNGWLVNSRQIAVVPDATGKDWSCVTAKLQNAEHAFGTLIYSSMTNRGEPILSKQSSVSSLLEQRLSASENSWSMGYVGEMVNIQVWFASDRPTTDEQVNRLTELQLFVREKARQEISKL